MNSAAQGVAAVSEDSFKVRALTQEEIATFRRDGVVHVKRLIDPECVDELLAAADDWALSPTQYAEQMAKQGSFLEGREIWPHQPAFKRYVFDSALAEQAASAMGAQEARFYFDHLFLLAANTAKDSYYWHQDLPYWACDGQQICSFWLALTSNGVDSGALEFVLDTDKGHIYLPAPFGDEDDSGYQTEATEVIPVPDYHLQRDRYRIVTFDITAGDALLFNARIMHSSRGNHSLTQRRVAYSTRWIGEDMVFRPRPGYQDPVTLPRQPLDAGASLAIDQFPKVWPR